MKTPKFWYRKTGAKALMLAPFGQLYRTAGLLRHAFIKPYRSTLPVVCVGNIVAGGAGKTPTSMALARLLIQRGLSPVFVTRGYGGNEKGPLQVDLKKHTSRDVGDEAVLLAQVAPCYIGRNRAQAIQMAEKDAPTHIILDDGLQNPKVAPDVNFLVVDGAVGFGNHQLIPAGPLRETLHDAFSRVAAIVMIGEDEQRIAAYLGKPVLQAHLRPSLSASFIGSPNVLAFAGIGRPSKFYASCREAGLNVVETLDFADHHIFTEDDIANLTSLAHNKELKLITTAKDWVRLPEPFRKGVEILDIELVFEDEEAALGFVLKNPDERTTPPCPPFPKN